MEEFRCYIHIGGPPRCGRNGKTSRYDGVQTLILRQAGGTDDVSTSLRTEEDVDGG